MKHYNKIRQQFAIVALIVFLLPLVWQMEHALVHHYNLSTKNDKKKLGIYTPENKCYFQHDWNILSDFELDEIKVIPIQSYWKIENCTHNKPFLNVVITYHKRGPPT